MKLIIFTPHLENKETIITQLQGMGHAVLVADTLERLSDLLRERVDLLIMGYDGRVKEGLREAQEVLAAYPNVKILLIATKPTIEDAVAAMQMGVVDILCQPFDADALRHAVERNLVVMRRVLSGLDVVGEIESGIVYRSPVMLNILRKAKGVARSKAAVLICGESGTGKELLARYIHENSDRKDAPFVALNCACLPETLLESELFGYEKGAFSGATARKLGKFELANGGTLFLDEITEMPISLQAKLLRVLQEGEVDRLGGTKPIKIDIRILSATNRNPQDAIRSGHLREDLFYRLNVIQLKLPPLRARREDIPCLADFFLKRFSKAYGKDGLKFANSTIEAMMSWPWPGNIRELKNAVERGVLLADGDMILPSDIWDDEGMFDLADKGWQLEQDIPSAEHPPALDAGSSLGDKKQGDDAEIMDLNTLERLTIQKALQKTEGNRTHAAQLLGISVRTLRNKLLEYRRMGIVL